ncbi:hypothetical protein QJS66_01410 [Kocuria rhizophila]|nr:hypothetical protein QJS66_01410 [Kocuria rhizophila]
MRLGGHRAHGRVARGRRRCCSGATPRTTGCSLETVTDAAAAATGYRPAALDGSSRCASSSPWTRRAAEPRAPPPGQRGWHRRMLLTRCEAHARPHRTLDLGMVRLRRRPGARDGPGAYATEAHTDVPALA